MRQRETHTETHTHPHMCTHTRTYTRTRARTHTHIVRAHTHTHTHTHTHSLAVCSYISLQPGRPSGLSAVWSLPPRRHEHRTWLAIESLSMRPFSDLCG